jgi:hypothetical protein
MNLFSRQTPEARGLGMTSQRARDRLIDRLKTNGIADRRVLHLIKMWLECAVKETDARPLATLCGSGACSSQACPACAAPAAHTAANSKARADFCKTARKTPAWLIASPARCRASKRRPRSE